MVGFYWNILKLAPVIAKSSLWTYRLVNSLKNGDRIEYYHQIEAVKHRRECEGTVI